MDKKLKMAPQLKKGDKVYLLTKNWKVKKPRTKKLDHVKETFHYQPEEEQEFKVEQILKKKSQ